MCTVHKYSLRVAERLDLLFPAGAQSHKVVPKLEEDLASRLPFSFSHLVNKNTEAALPSLPYEIGSTSNCAVSQHRSLSQDQRWLRWRVPTKPLDQEMLSYRSRTGLSFWSGQNNMQLKTSSFFSTWTYLAQETAMHGLEKS